MALIVIDVDTPSSGRPPTRVRMSSIESIATPTLPTSPSARGWSESSPIWVGQVEGARQPCLPGCQKKLEPFVRRLRRPEPGVLAHRPEPAAVHVPLDAPRVREDARLAELHVGIEAVQVRRPCNGGGSRCRSRSAARRRRSPSAKRKPPQPAATSTGACLGCGMQRSSYSAMTISPACSPQAGQAGSRRTLKVRNDCSRAS